MAYTKTNWLARLGTGLNKYKDTNNNNQILALVHQPDSITQEGTPLSAENLNKMEEGIYNAHVTADGAVQKNGGETSETVVGSFSASQASFPVPAAGERHKVLWGKVAKFFSDVVTRLNNLKALSNKDKVAAGDYTSGSIVNADISSSAAIAQSKINGLETSLNGKASSTHTHGNITNDGKVGTVADKLLYTGTGGAVAAKTVAELKALFLDITHPVGSIFMSATLSTTTAVTNALGGTWAVWGKGRVPVGVDPNDTDFDAAEETGGQKAAVIPSHTHSYNSPPSTTGGHTLTENEIPSHKHIEQFPYTGGHYPDTVTYYPLYAGKSDTGHQNTGFRATNISFLNNAPTGTSESTSSTYTGNTGGSGSHNHSITAGSGTTGATGDASTSNKNLQPYITCYMYKRTA